MNSINKDINYQNILEEIQGKWNCTKAFNKMQQELLNLKFELLFSENLISRTGQEGADYWPNISNFELVGSNKDGYFYREDGCFMEIKSLSNNDLVIELHQKDAEGQLTTVVFTFTRDLN